MKQGMPDDWLAADKLQHLVACFGITALAYAFLGRGKGVTLLFGAPTHRRRLALACAAGLAVGISKECLDAADVRWSTTAFLCPVKHKLTAICSS